MLLNNQLYNTTSPITERLWPIRHGDYENSPCVIIMARIRRQWQRALFYEIMHVLVHL
jgi:hypothetical protein